MRGEAPEHPSLARRGQKWPSSKGLFGPRVVARPVPLAVTAQSQTAPGEASDLCPPILATPCVFARMLPVCVSSSGNSLLTLLCPFLPWAFSHRSVITVYVLWILTPHPRHRLRTCTPRACPRLLFPFASSCHAHVSRFHTWCPGGFRVPLPLPEAPTRRLVVTGCQTVRDARTGTAWEPCSPSGAECKAGHRALCLNEVFPPENRFCA